MAKVTITGEKEILLAIDKKIANIEAATKKILIDFFSKVVLKTPVDTGHARANWQVSTGSPTDNIIEDEDKSGQQTIANIVSDILKSNLKQNDVYYLSNNLPYIGVLEDGSSNQSPNGMIKSTIPEFDGIIKSVEKEI
jgi:hypothetical protein